jgi:hypothetical protein
MTYVVVKHTTIWSRPRLLLKYKRPSLSWSYGGVIYNYICHILLKYKSCISVIYDICSCKSHHHMITTTTASFISVIYDIFSCKSHHHMSDHMVVWFTTTYVIYYWNTRGCRGRDHMVMWFTTTSVIYMTYVAVNHTTICSRTRRPLVFL